MGVPYEWPGRGTRYLGSQRLHASATETEAHVAQKQAQDKEKGSHLQQDCCDESPAHANCTCALLSGGKPEISLANLLLVTVLKHVFPQFPNTTAA